MDVQVTKSPDNYQQLNYGFTTLLKHMWSSLLYNFVNYFKLKKNVVLEGVQFNKLYHY